MQSLLNFLVNYQNWIYTILVAVALIYLRRLIYAWREWRSTIFGLERDSAQSKLNASLAMVILVFLLIAAEFVCLTFVVPEFPQTQSAQGPVPTEGPDTGILPTVEATSGLASGVVLITPTGAVPNAETDSAETATPLALTGTGCLPGQLEWIAPKSGEEISGLYELVATVNFQELGFYKYHYSPLTDQVNWTAISAGNLPIVEGVLGVLATTEISNGDYVLRLTALDKNNFEYTPCDVAVRILNSQ